MISIGRLRAPYVDDVEHYAKLLGHYTRLSQIELRDAGARDGSAQRLGARLPRLAADNARRISGVRIGTRRMIDPSFNVLF